MSSPDDALPDPAPLPYAGRPQGSHPIPAKAATFAMWLFLAMLTMLFAAGLVGYLMIRFDLTRLGIEEQPGNVPRPAPLVRVHLSPLFILSTLLVMAASVTIHLAVLRIRRQLVSAARFWIWVTLGLALLFCIVQFPGLTDLWKQHVGRLSAGANMARLIAVLIVVHALHVFGGVVYLLIVADRARRGVYDHEHYVGIRHAAMYWHFLDIVWLVMYGTMLAAG